jgi:hypothetical protein
MRQTQRHTTTPAFTRYRFEGKEAKIRVRRYSHAAARRDDGKGQAVGRRVRRFVCIPSELRNGAECAKTPLRVRIGNLFGETLHKR